MFLKEKATGQSVSPAMITKAPLLSSINQPKAVVSPAKETWAVRRKRVCQKHLLARSRGVPSTLPRYVSITSNQGMAALAAIARCATIAVRNQDAQSVAKMGRMVYGRTEFQMIHRPSRGPLVK